MNECRFDFFLNIEYRKKVNLVDRCRNYFKV